ncbi:MAG: NAD(P)-dependent alcohol dehydrogenase [Phycisphaerales bacterium]|nr:NAD(P)-dependent alcohol dehydrogenase [Phycisphaerales bacterium]
MTTVNAYAASEASSKLEPFTYELDDLGANQVDIKVEACGICHSDISMLDNEWGMTEYPFVPGHEIVGIVESKGDAVTHLEVGQRVGVGWHSGCCMHCTQCMKGDHNLCSTAEQTIVGRHGGFADRVRVNGTWAIPIPDSVDPVSAGPLFCGGITVFNPLVQLGIKPTDRVGVIGIGGLGHMALMFLNKWGCEVTAFTSSDSKAEEARKMGAHRIVNSRDDDALEAEAGRFNLILSTVNVSLNWDAYINALAPKGKLHNVGAVLEPIPVGAFSLIMAQRSISGSPVGSAATIADMLEFSGRHQIQPIIETFPMSKVNDAIEHLKAGNARYRIVLTNN